MEGYGGGMDGCGYHTFYKQKANNRSHSLLGADRQWSCHAELSATLQRLRRKTNGTLYRSVVDYPCCCFRVLPKGGNESCQSLRHVGVLHDRWRHHLSPPPQFKHGTGGEGNILQLPSPVVSATTTLNIFRPTDLTNTYSVCSQRVFGGIGHRTQAVRSDYPSFMRYKTFIYK
ncbi:uncharacterized protein TNCV_2703021 [Trichonephila clavipes]|nr:uncharacterized protein TNCV_2703021 [Trichonephila clavipes]